MTSELRKVPRIWCVTLSVYALLDAGCHGWLPYFVSPMLVLVAGCWLVAGTGPCSIGDRWRFARVVPIALGLFAKQAWNVESASAAGLLASLALTVEVDHAGRPLRRVTVAAVVALGTLHVLLATGMGHFIEEAVASGLAATATVVAGRALDLDPVFGGARAFLILVVIVLAVGGSALRQAKSIGALSLTGIAATAAVGLTAERMPPFGSSPGNAPILAALAAQLPWVPMAMFTLVSLVTLRLRDAELSHSRGPITALGVVASVLVVCAWPGTSAAQRPGVLFYKPGFSNWMTPDPNFANAGEYSAGMLGTLPAFAQALGTPASLVEDFSAEELARFGTLVFVNQMAPLGDQKLAEIERWVRDGGRLLVVGDHTAYHHDKASGRTEIFLNEPLQFTGIRFPNNSSDHLTMAYREGVVELGVGRPLTCVRGNPLGCVIGAGLSLQWPAVPVSIGRYGYVDEGKFGDEEHSEFLGDLTWNPGERLGGVVNVAWQRVGMGSVLAVGDTTGITNIGRCFGWEAWARWLAGDLFPDRLLHWIHGVGLLGLTWMLFASRRLPDAAVLSACIVFGVLAWTTAGNRGEQPCPRGGPEAPVTVLELAVRPPGRLGGWGKDGLLGVAVTAMRINSVPLFADTTETEALQGASTLVIACPQMDPGSAWATNVASWTRAGGHTIVSCSYPESLHVRPLLDRFGAGMDPVLVGAISADLGTLGGVPCTVTLRESWRMRFHEAGWRKIVYRDDRVLVATRPYGAGRVTIISDSTFLRNGALEGEWGANPKNLQFVKVLLGGKEWS